MLKRIKVAALALAMAIAAAGAMAPAAQADGPPKHHWKHSWKHDRDDDWHGRKHWKHKKKHHGGWKHTREEVNRIIIVERHDRPRYYHKPRTYDRRDYRPRHYSGSPEFLNIGSAIGGIAGAILGNQIGSGSGKTVATVGGAIAGVFVGNSIYQGMQRADELKVARTLESTPSGHTVAWQNPDTGHRYRVTPQPAFRTGGDRICREYTSWAFIDGYEKQLTGTACRDADGRWQLMN